MLLGFFKKLAVNMFSLSINSQSCDYSKFLSLWLAVITQTSSNVQKFVDCIISNLFPVLIFRSQHLPSLTSGYIDNFGPFRTKCDSPRNIQFASGYHVSQATFFHLLIFCLHRRRTFCIFFVYPFFAYIAPSVAENRV